MFLIDCFYLIDAEAENNKLAKDGDKCYTLFCYLIRNANANLLAMSQIIVLLLEL